MQQIKTSNYSLFLKGITIGITNIFRNKFLSLATIFVIGIIIFIFNIIIAINFIATDALTNLSKKVDLIVYVKEGVAYQDAISVAKDISNLEGVLEVKYTSKEDALKQLKTTHPDLILAFEKYELGNPLPASLNIITKHPKYHESVFNLLKEDKFSKYLSIFDSEKAESDQIITSVSKNLSEVTNFTNQIIFWLVVTFLIGGALVILNALQITIFNRKKEISVMKMVGAPFWFIRLPYITEGIFYGIAAVILSLIMFILITQSTALADYYTFTKFYLLLAGEVVFATLLCIASSSIAVYQYLNKHI